jgi:predicted tellurium resistance membrane protein TerC
MFGQQFDPHDIVLVGLLVVLEGVLSIDNALVLGLLAKRLPRHQQKRGLTYGLVGAFIFRLIAVGTAAYLLKWRIVKLAGGGYLIYIAVKHLFFERGDGDNAPARHVVTLPDGQVVLADSSGTPIPPERAEAEILQRSPVPIPAATDDEVEESAQRAATATGVLPDQTQKPRTAPDCDEPGSRRKCARFWPTVIVIELTDIAFAVDSILAAIALVGSAPLTAAGVPMTPHPKLWVVLTGGMLGVILMRVAAVMFIKLLDRFPRFEMAAYLLVIVIGLKLLADWLFNSAEHPHRIDFHSYHRPEFWAFWGLMIAAFCVGFLPKKGEGGPGFDMVPPKPPPQ